MISPWLWVIILLGLLVLAGVWYERRAEQVASTRFPAPGALVDVGGHHLHVVCMGQKRPGQPTVILEAGHGDWSMSWCKVQPEIARFARVCAYDRAGFGWSEPGPLPRSPRQLVSELHTLLERAGETPPYLFVGHSLGASFSRLYASLYPQEVAGMVWVDSAHEDMLRYLPFWRPAYWAILAATRGASLLARVGLVRLLARQHTFAIYPGAVTPDDRRLAAAHMAVPRYFSTMRAETIAWYHQPNWQASLPAFGSLPILMLVAQYPVDAPRGYPRRQWQQYLTGWQAIQEDLSRLSTRTTRVIVCSGHVIQIEHPEPVVQAVKELLDLLAGT